MKPFVFLLGLIVVLTGLLFTTIRSINSLRNDFLGLKKNTVFA